MGGSVAAAAPAKRAPTAPRAQHLRLRAVWAAVLASLLGLLFAGLTAVTITLWATDPTYAQTNPLVDLAFFALGAMAAAGFASQIRGRQVAGLQQAILALVALAAAGWLGGRLEPFARLPRGGSRRGRPRATPDTDPLPLAMTNKAG